MKEPIFSEPFSKEIKHLNSTKIITNNSYSSARESTPSFSLLSNLIQSVSLSSRVSCAALSQCLQEFATAGFQIIKRRSFFFPKKIPSVVHQLQNFPPLSYVNSRRLFLTCLRSAPWCPGCAF